MSIRAYRYMNVDVYVYRCTSKPTCKHVKLYICTHLCRFVCSHPCIDFVCMHIPLHINAPGCLDVVFFVCCDCIRLHAYLDNSTDINVYMYVCAHGNTHRFGYICLHARTIICMHRRVCAMGGWKSTHACLRMSIRIPAVTYTSGYKKTYYVYSTLCI